MGVINFYTEQCGVHIYPHSWWKKAGKASLHSCFHHSLPPFHNMSPCFQNG